MIKMNIETRKQVLLNAKMKEFQTTFEQQCKQKRRPRISFENTYKQLCKSQNSDKFLLIWNGLVSDLLDPNRLFQPVRFKPETSIAF